MSAGEVFRELQSGKNGLSEKEAEKRLLESGYNEISDAKQSAVLKFISKLYGPVPLLLWVVLILSYALGHFKDFAVVLVLLIFNATVGFLEEHKADHSIEMLKKRLSTNARVLRSGSWVSIPSKFLVKGDVIRVRMGDVIPADLKILELEALQVDESALTGESLPVRKQAGNIAYEGSAVKAGEATCMVIATGNSTFYGKTAALVKIAKPKPHLEKVILKIVKYLIIADSVIIAVMFIFGIILFNVSLSTLLPLLLVVLIASVPVALPAAFTVSMALGTEYLAKHSILVRKLDSIEGAATANVLCLDKTGTLTENRIVVKDIVTFGCSEDDVIMYAAEASRAEDNDVIDNAILKFATEKKIRISRQLSFSPFDPSTKRTEAKITGGGYLVTKGATIAVGRLCKLSRTERADFEGAVERLSKQGFRSLAVATTHNNSNKYKLVGIVALYDPPRKDARLFINELEKLGVKTKMLTGDNIAVANQMASELGFKGSIVAMSDIKKLNDKQLFKAVEDADGFADIYPSDKYNIVKALQNNGLSVGMTGDGINDAPALKQAEVGIAVSNATDVAKSAAALVLTKNGIDVIAEAVKESRRTFERMMTYTLAKVVKVFQIIGIIAVLFIALHGFIAITPFLLILLIFTNDIVNIAISTDNANYSKSPDVWNIKSIVYSSAIIGVLLLIETLGVAHAYLYQLGLTAAGFQTAMFLFLDVSDKFTVFNVRSRRYFWDIKPSRALLVSSISGAAAGILISYYGILVQGISLQAITLILISAGLFFIINDYVKSLVFKKLGIY